MTSATECERPSLVLPCQHEADGTKPIKTAGYAGIVALAAYFAMSLRGTTEFLSIIVSMLSLKAAGLFLVGSIVTASMDCRAPHVFERFFEDQRS